MTFPHEIDEESNLSAGADFTYFLNLAGEHAWKAGVAYTRASANKNTLVQRARFIHRMSGDRHPRQQVEVRGGPVPFTP